MAAVAASLLLLQCVVTMLAGAATADAQYSAQTFVDLQNAARADVGVAPLAWDDTLAAYAQRYAGERKGDCKLVHSYGPYGESIFWGSEGGDWTAGDAVATWVQEKQNYNCSDGLCAAGQVCGHYTQIVWANTTRVGCAAVACDGNLGTFVLCEYDPPGNFLGFRPYAGCGQFNRSAQSSPQDFLNLQNAATARWRPMPMATRRRGRAIAGKSSPAGRTARTSSKAVEASAGPSPTPSSPGSERNRTTSVKATRARRGRPAGSIPSSSGPTQPELAGWLRERNLRSWGHVHHLQLRPPWQSCRGAPLFGLRGASRRHSAANFRDKVNGTVANGNGNGSSANSSNPSRNGSSPAILPIVLPVVTIIGLFSAISIYIWIKRPSPKKTLSYKACSEDIEDIKSMLLDPSVIRTATSNFSEEHKLGEGGFGQVYKGMMPDGQEIAVKRLSEGSKQGLPELKNELLLVAKLQHRNLVKLIGACLDGEDKLLVYEYIPKKSLDDFIFDDERRGKLAWDTRYKIICGIARGLAYLHDESRIKVIHRDLKPSNILLEMDMNPKISDFGLASVFEDDHTKHITRRVAGTYGYMAPEYAVLGHVSTKSDVFSFGMILLEIVTGRRNSVSSETMMAEHLLTYVWENWTRGTKAEIVDPSLHYNYSESEVLKCVHIGLLCVQESPSDRPGMSNVILMLVGRSTTLPAPSRPAFLFRLNDENHVPGDLNNLLDDSNKSNPSLNKLTITEFEPR